MKLLKLILALFIFAASLSAAEPALVGSTIVTVDGSKSVTGVYHYVDADGTRGFVYSVVGSTAWYSDTSTGLRTKTPGL